MFTKRRLQRSKQIGSITNVDYGHVKKSGANLPKLRESRARTRMMHDLSVLSFNSSIMMEYGFDILSTTLLRN